MDWGTEGEKNVRGREEKIPSRSSLGGFDSVMVAGSVLLLVIVGLSCVRGTIRG